MQLPSVSVCLQDWCGAGLGVLHRAPRDESATASPAKDNALAASTPPATPTAASAVQRDSASVGRRGSAGPTRVISRDI
jgi:hypothetical protein